MKHKSFPFPVPLALVLALAPILVLGACAGGFSTAALAPGADQIRPKPRPGGVAAPDADAVTVDQFDTTTEADRVAATAGANGAEVRVGRTVAALGNPADPGFWLETPLVGRVRQGRVVSAANGKGVQVELRPIEGDPGAGSRISLPALRLLEVGLTGLHELDVFAG